MFRRISGILAALLAAFSIVVVTAGPASAATNRTMAVWGSVHIEDYESFAANEHCYSSMNTSHTANPYYPISIEWIRMCGGEIRAELHMQGQVLSNNSLHVIGKALFYEGTSATTNDLDGRKDFTLLVTPNTTRPLNLTVWNSDEGDCDCAWYNLRVANYAP